MDTTRDNRTGGSLHIELSINRFADNYLLGGKLQNDEEWGRFRDANTIVSVGLHREKRTSCKGVWDPMLM